MSNDRLPPAFSMGGSATCPYCQEILTKTEAVGAACPSCKEAFAVIPEPGPDDCPKCRIPLKQTRIDCGVCGWCGLQSADWEAGPKKCPTCKRKLFVMELPATTCESCHSISVKTDPIRLMKLCQILAFLIVIMFVVWPVLDLWSPQFSKWMSDEYGIKIPIFVRIIVAGIGGGIAAAIATPPFEGANRLRQERIQVDPIRHRRFCFFIDRFRLILFQRTVSFSLQL